MKTNFFAFACFILFSIISSSSQAGSLPLHRPCLPNSAEVSASMSHRAIPSERRDWTAGQPVSLIQKDSLAGWTSNSGQKPSSGWSVQDGILHLKGKGGDIVSEREYENFILEFAWTIAKGGNSGIKYRYKKYVGNGWLGLEYQILDDFNTSEGKKPKNNTATLYDVLSADASRKHLNPNDQLNYGKIIVCGQHIEHYLNGEKVLEITPGSEQWYEAVMQSKFNDVKDFGMNSAGRIMVQDHNCEVWLHSLVIRELEPALPLGFPHHRCSLPCFAEYRSTLPAVPVCGDYHNVNTNRYFGQLPPQIMEKPICTTPYAGKCCAPQCIPQYRCIFSNLFSR